MANMRPRKLRRVYLGADEDIARQLREHDEEIDELDREVREHFDEGQNYDIQPTSWVTDDQIRALKGFCDEYLSSCELEDLAEILGSFPWGPFIDSDLKTQYQTYVAQIQARYDELSQTQIG